MTCHSKPRMDAETTHHICEKPVVDADSALRASGGGLLYDRLFVRTPFTLGEGLWKVGDGMIIDGFGPDGIFAATRELAHEARRLQSGYVYHYALAMLIGVVVLVTWYPVPR